MIRYLDPFHIATQGAGFRLTPIAMAVQGFLTYREDESGTQNYGGGQKVNESTRLHEKESENDLILKVLDKWDYIESVKEKAQKPTAPEINSTNDTQDQPQLSRADPEGKGAQEFGRFVSISNPFKKSPMPVVSPPELAFPILRKEKEELSVSNELELTLILMEL